MTDIRLSDATRDEENIIASDKDMGADFLTWFSETFMNYRARATGWDEQDDDVPTADVPCGDCHACCTGGYDIPVKEWEYDRETCEAYYPADSSPDLVPKTYYRLKKKEDGSCIHWDGQCGIYDDRPEACRFFDCRDQLATGIADPEIADAVKRWNYKQWLDGPRENRMLLIALRMAAHVAHQMHHETNVMREKAFATFPQYLAHAMMKQVEEEEVWDPTTFVAHDLFQKALKGEVTDLALAGLMSDGRGMHGHVSNSSYQNLAGVLAKVLNEVSDGIEKEQQSQH